MNLLSSIWNYKCPRCRTGDLFIAPFNPKDPLNMHKECSHCKLNFHREPGYYYGAMFISYIWTGFLCLSIVRFCMLVLGWGVNSSMAMLIFIMAVMYFFVMRVSRAIYIHLDIKYNPTQINP